MCAGTFGKSFGKGSCEGLRNGSLFFSVRVRQGSHPRPRGTVESGAAGSGSNSNYRGPAFLQRERSQGSTTSKFHSEPEAATPTAQEDGPGLGRDPCSSLSHSQPRLSRSQGEEEQAPRGIMPNALHWSGTIWKFTGISEHPGRLWVGRLWRLRKAKWKVERAGAEEGYQPAL